jgi:hypothetical protein
MTGQLTPTIAQLENVTLPTESPMTSSTPAAIDTTTNPIHKEQQQLVNVNSIPSTPTEAISNVSSALRANDSSGLVRSATDVRNVYISQLAVNLTDDFVSSENDTVPQHNVTSDDGSYNKTMLTTSFTVAVVNTSLTSTRDNVPSADVRGTYKQADGDVTTTTSATLTRTSLDKDESVVTGSWYYSNGTPRHSDDTAVKSSLSSNIDPTTPDTVSNAASTATMWNSSRIDGATLSRQQPIAFSTTHLTYVHRTGNDSSSSNSFTEFPHESKSDDVASQRVNTSYARSSVESSTTSFFSQQASSNPASGCH